MGSEASEAYEEDFEKSSEARQILRDTARKIPQKNVDNGCKLTVCWEHLGFSLILISIYLEKQNQKHTTQIHNYNGKKKTKRMNHQVEIPKLTCQASEEEAEEEEKSPEEEEETLTR